MNDFLSGVKEIKSALEKRYHLATLKSRENFKLAKRMADKTPSY